jgi:hypothetical protein
MFTEKQVEVAEQCINQVKKLAQKHGVPELVVVTILSDVKRAEFLNSMEDVAESFLSMIPSQKPVFEVDPDEKIVVSKTGRVRASKKNPVESAPVDTPEPE